MFVLDPEAVARKAAYELPRPIDTPDELGLLFWGEFELCHLVAGESELISRVVVVQARRKVLALEESPLAT